VLLNNCKTLVELATVFKSLNIAEKTETNSLKEELKLKLK